MNLDLADEGSWQIAVVFVRHMNYLCILHLPVGLRHVLEIASSLCGSDLSTAITIRTVSYGLLGLYGSLECVQLATANRIYLMTADFCAWLSNRNINWSVENPGRSYLRELSCFIRLHSLALFYDFVLCR